MLSACIPLLALVFHIIEPFFKYHVVPVMVGIEHAFTKNCPFSLLPILTSPSPEDEVLCSPA